MALNKQNPGVQVNGQATTIVALNNQNLGMQTQVITLFGLYVISHPTFQNSIKSFSQGNPSWDLHPF